VQRLLNYMKGSVDNRNGLIFYCTERRDELPRSTDTCTTDLLTLSEQHICFDKAFCDNSHRAGSAQEFAVSTKAFLTSSIKYYYFFIILMQSILSFSHILLVACYIVSLS